MPVRTPHDERGALPVIIAVLVLVVLLGGGAYFFNASRGTGDREAQTHEGTPFVTDAPDATPAPSVALDGQALGTTGLADVSLSALPGLDAPSLAVPTMDFPSAGDAFSGLAVPALAVPTPAPVELTAPAVNLGYMPPSVPQGMPAGSVPPAAMPTQGATQQPTIDCNQFVALPSCSYVPAGPAQDACRTCKGQ